MSFLDWSVLIASLIFIVVYGIWKSRNNKNINNYLLGRTMPWYAVGLSVMATQASAITFLSAPGQAYTDGMRFVQFYFGLPIAMIVLSVTVVPLFYRMNVFTAYEFLETRFDLKTRSLAAFLFLTQRGLAAGLTIYAPSIILSSIFGWNIYLTNIFMGGIVIIYTVAGGTRAVSYTQLGQMAIIIFGMLVAGMMVVRLLPSEISFLDTLKVAGKMGKLNVVDFSFDWNNRYNIWSGLIGGFFLAMSYFGTDQSQVARYLSGKSITESRLGLLFNGLVKIPMQFCILFIGAVLFVFYLYETPPIFFNSVETDKLKQSEFAKIFSSLEQKHFAIANEKKLEIKNLLSAIHENDEQKIIFSQAELKQKESEEKKVRTEAIDLMKKNDPLSDTNDTNYIFLSFVTHYLPHGLIGLLIAVIFAASMSSTSSELNSLASTTVVDIYKRSLKKDGTAKHYLHASRWATVLWGIYAIGVAEFANKMGTLIEAVNILGSLFYGTILGIFLTAFYLKTIRGSAAFYAALISEAVVVYCYHFTQISFLWYNVIGCGLVMGLSFLFNGKRKEQEMII